MKNIVTNCDVSTFTIWLRCIRYRVGMSFVIRAGRVPRVRVLAGPRRLAPSPVCAVRAVRVGRGGAERRCAGRWPQAWPAGGPRSSGAASRLRLRRAWRGRWRVAGARWGRPHLILR